MFECGVDQCTFTSPNLRVTMRHIRNLHMYAPNFKRVCGVGGCENLYNSANALRLHVMQRHAIEWYQNCDGEQRSCAHQQDMPSASPEPPTCEVHGEGSDDVATSGPEYEAKQKFEEMMKTSRQILPAMNLRLQYKYVIPKSVSRQIHNEYMDYIKFMRRKWSEAMCSYSEKFEIDDDFNRMMQCPELEEICNTSTHREHARLKALGLVDPVEVQLAEEARGIDIGDNPLLEAEHDPDDLEVDVDDFNAAGDLDSARDDSVEGNGEGLGQERPQAGITTARELYHYVPILDTLKAYLKHDDVVFDLMRGGSDYQAGCGYYEDFSSGYIYSRTPRFRDNPNHLRIGLYTDEITVTNPLATHSKKHKLAVVYFTLNNLRTYNLSCFKSTHLVLVCKWSYVKKYSYTVVLNKLLKDLQILSNDGIAVTTLSGRRLTFYGSLAFISSDNLSAHALGGHRCSFSSGKVCRFCLVDYSNLRNVTCSADCTLRTEESVRMQADLITADPFLKRVYGIMSKSCLYSLDGFSTVTYLPPDCMHDILECFMPTHIGQLIRALHQKKVLNFKIVQQRMASFQYGRLDGVNKHPGLADDWVTKKKRVGGTAAEKWCLFRLLPCMIGTEVPQGNEHWELFLLGLQIAEIVLAPRLSDEVVSELAFLIDQHHKKWVLIYPDVFPAKFHYLVHYPQLMQEFGPLRHLWCMRFESFHQVIKRILVRARNFINETKTACERFQKQRCLEYADACGLPPRIKFVNRQETVSLQSIVPEQARHCISALLDCPANTAFISTTHLLHNGVAFRVGSYNILGLSSASYPIFFETKLIVVWKEETVVLYGCFIETDYYNEHLQAYVIMGDSETDSNIAILPTDLKCSQTLHAYTLLGKRYIRYRFRPVSCK